MAIYLQQQVIRTKMPTQYYQAAQARTSLKWNTENEMCIARGGFKGYWGQMYCVCATQNGKSKKTKLTIKEEKQRDMNQF